MAKTLSSEQFFLRWNNFSNNLTTGFLSHFTDNDLVDVTLAVEGQLIRAHKLVLSVCSPYFKNIFKENPCQHPVIILKDIKYVEVESLLKFMYQGEINIKQDDLPTFLKVAQSLQIKGLAAEENEPANLIHNLDGQFSILPDDQKSVQQTHLDATNISSKDTDATDRQKRSRDVIRKSAKKKKRDLSLTEGTHEGLNKDVDDDIKQEVLLLSNEDSDDSMEQDEERDTSGTKDNGSNRKEQLSGSSNTQTLTENSSQSEPAISLRLNGQHFPVRHAATLSNGRSTRRRCVVCSSKRVRRETIYQCDNCAVPLCIDHFRFFHTVEHY